MENKHTEGKWFVSDEGRNGIFIKTNKSPDALAKIYTENYSVKSKEQALANAERIVTIVNGYDQLERAVNSLLEELERQEGLFPEIKKDGYLRGRIMYALRLINDINNQL